MKYRPLWLLLTAVAVLGWAQAASAQGITGTVHDLSGKSWNTENQLCDVCHTPHDANTAVTDAPLWHRDETVATFTVYTRATLDATVGQPDGVTKLCLSCHDGTVALEQYGGSHGRYTTSTYTTWGNLGTDLSDDHPVSFVYDTALSTADGELADPAVATSGMGSTIDVDMLFDGKVQCSSCHDVHDKVGDPQLLRKSNAYGALCLTCHLK